MTLRLTLLFGLLLAAVVLKGQTDFRPGYVILKNNDTLFGEIDYRGDYLMGLNCRFKMNDTETNYSPDDIASFRFVDSKYFVSKEADGKKTFLEFLIKGQVNIYYLREETRDSYFLEKEGMGLTKLPYVEEIISKGNKQYLYKSTRHFGVLKHYMRDAPEFQSKIDNLGKPDHKNLIKLAENYHNTVCKDSVCIIYEKKLPPLKVDLEFLAGIVGYNNSSAYKDRVYFQGGIITHFWLPRSSEKLFFRTGILLSYIQPTDVFYANYLDPPFVEGAILKLPIQLEYLYPRARIQPKAAFGINIYKPFYQSVAFMGGVNLRLNETAYFTINYDIDFGPSPKFPLLPKRLLSQSVLAGLLFKL